MVITIEVNAQEIFCPSVSQTATFDKNAKVWILDKKRITSIMIIVYKDSCVIFDDGITKTKFTLIDNENSYNAIDQNNVKCTFNFILCSDGNEELVLRYKNKKITFK